MFSCTRSRRKFDLLMRTRINQRSKHVRIVFEIINNFLEQSPPVSFAGFKRFDLLLHALNSLIFFHVWFLLCFSKQRKRWKCFAKAFLAGVWRLVYSGFMTRVGKTTTRCCVSFLVSWKKERIWMTFRCKVFQGSFKVQHGLGLLADPIEAIWVQFVPFHFCFSNLHTFKTKLGDDLGSVR